MGAYESVLWSIYWKNDQDQWVNILLLATQLTFIYALQNLKVKGRLETSVTTKNVEVWNNTQILYLYSYTHGDYDNMSLEAFID